jgi:hypothetical protein
VQIIKTGLVRSTVLTQSGEDSTDVKLDNRMDAFHRFVVGSPPATACLRLMKSYTLRVVPLEFEGVEPISEDAGRSLLSCGSSERSLSESSRSRPLEATNSLCGLIWNTPPEASTERQV